MNLINAIILGIIEGVTEFLPVSSTAHLILAAELLGLVQDEFLKSFEIMIQLGAILAVIVLYGKSLIRQPRIWARIAAAFLPTAVVGMILYKIIKNVFFENTGIILWALFLGGLILIIFDRFHRENAAPIDDVADIPVRTAFVIGCFQALAVIPGVSRAAATIIGGLMFGIKRKTIVEFSFLLAVPTMLAASGYDLIKTAPAFSSDQLIFLLVGLVTAFAVALLSITFLLRFIRHHNFMIFGIYRMILPILWLCWHNLL